jgi:hypothetical protein
MNQARKVSAGIRRSGRRVVGGAALLVAAMCAAPAALAHSHVGISIGVGSCWGCGYPAPAPVYYAPAYPPPVYYPPTVYYAPPVYYGYTYGYAPYYRSPRHGRGYYYYPRHHGHHGQGRWSQGHGHYGHGHH